MNISHTFAHAYKHKKESLIVLGYIALFFILLAVLSGAFFGHIESLANTLGAYTQVVLEESTTSPNGVSFAQLISDSILIQGVIKLLIAFFLLFSSLFLVINCCGYLVFSQITSLFHQKEISFLKFSKKNVIWLLVFLVYTLIYTLFNLKFRLIDGVIEGSSGELIFLNLIDIIVKLLFVFFMLQSYTTKKQFSLPNFRKVGYFLLFLVTFFVLDQLSKSLTVISEGFYVPGFIILCVLVYAFLLLFFHTPKSHSSQTHSHSKTPGKSFFYAHIFGFVVLLLVVFLPSSLFLITGVEETGVIKEKVQLQTTEDLALLLRTSSEELAILEESNVKVLIIEFSDFGCPFCAGAQPIIDEYAQNESLFVYRRHFPIVSAHPHAYVAALFYECLKDRGVAFEAREWLYANQESPSMIEFAQDLGFSQSEIQLCMDSEQIQSRISHDIEIVHQLGFDATPTYILLPLSDPQSYQLVDGANSAQFDFYIEKWI